MKEGMLGEEKGETRDDESYKG